VSWTVYVLRCCDNTLYTGVTTDLERRVEEHRSGEGAKYTRGRGPIEIVYTETGYDQGAALSREHEIKSLSKSEKESLVA
jgi:putative endonuclease